MNRFAARRLVLVLGLLVGSRALAGTPEAGPSGLKATARSKADVEALIQQAGSTPPAWWDSVPLEYPHTLDLSWPERPQGPWNPQRNIGQYIWTAINENPGRWRSGIRFLHHLLTVYKDDRAKLGRAMDALASSYHRLFQDWARAAFWWRKAAELGPLPFKAHIDLAECYWQLGNRAMALAELKQASGYYAVGIIKLLSDMGDLPSALREAEEMAEGGAPDDACLAAGDACRLHGKLQQAEAYYRKVLTVPLPPKDPGRIKRNHDRATATLEALRVSDALDFRRIPDGTYASNSIGYEAPIHVAVEVRGSRIVSVRVTQHREKQFYAALTATPRQIVAKQSVRGIDCVTGATITSEAIINATAKALAGAMK